MENHVSLTSLMIVVIISFLVPIVIHRLRWTFIPIVVAEIVAGIIVGKTGFNLVEADTTLQLMSNLGLIYLLFLSGLEINFGMLKSNQKKQAFNPLLLGSVLYALILLISLGFGWLMVPLDLATQPYLMALIIATISLSIVMPVLKENNMIRNVLGQTILLVAVIGDFVTMILLAVFISFASTSGSNPILIATLFIAFVILYLVLKPLSKRDLFQRLSKGTIQLGTRGAFALILFFVALSETVGAESILGAFLAGAILSLLSPKEELLQKLDSFGYGFLIPIFLVMVGVNLDLRALFADPSVLILLPYLLFALYASKMIPTLLLKKWFPWRETVSAGFLLSSTLSLVIAAATISLELNLIEPFVHDAFILVAVLTCLISPILFNRLMPKEAEDTTPTVSIIGVNGSTLPVGLGLKKEGYRVTLYGQPQAKVQPKSTNQQTKFPIVEVPSLSLEELLKHKVLDVDILVLATGNEDFNHSVALYAKEQDEEQRIIVMANNPDIQEDLDAHGITAFSTLFATNTLLKGLIKFPAAVNLLTKTGDSIQEIEIADSRYDQLLLRQLPFLGDTLILRIYRGEDFIIPHGDTHLQTGDRLIVTGSQEHLQELREELG